MSAGVLLPSVADSAAAGESLAEKRGRRRVRSPVAPATSGDHAAIYFFLSDVFQGPTRAEFKASLEDPFYEPRDRLLLRRGRPDHRPRPPDASRDAVRPRCRSPSPAWIGWASRRTAAVRGWAPTCWRPRRSKWPTAAPWSACCARGIPHFFRRTGWALCGRHSYSLAGTHAVLARLFDHGLRPGRHPRLHIRPWRRWEERALVRIYNQNLTGRYGPLERTPAYWQWLLRRHAYDQLYVALDGPDLWDLKETSTPIVGYAAIRGERIVEVDDRPRAAQGGGRVARPRLRRRHRARPPQHRAPRARDQPAVRDLRRGGRRRYHHEADHGEVYMARLLDPVGLLRQLGGEFLRRAEEAGLPRPLELGLLVDGRKYQLEITRRSAVGRRTSMGRSYLRLNVADFTRLVLGQLDWDQALAEGRIEASTALARETGRVLFHGCRSGARPWMS